MNLLIFLKTVVGAYSLVTCHSTNRYIVKRYQVYLLTSLLIKNKSFSLQLKTSTNEITAILIFKLAPHTFDKIAVDKMSVDEMTCCKTF